MSSINEFREMYDVHGADAIRFEALNLGGKATSLESAVVLTAYSTKGKRVRGIAYITAPSRDKRLATHQAKTYEAHFSANNRTTHLFWYLKKYTFRQSHRGKRNIYLLHSSGKPISAFRYWFEVVTWHKGTRNNSEKMNR